MDYGLEYIVLPHVGFCVADCLAEMFSVFLILITIIKGEKQRVLMNFQNTMLTFL